jgi:hypothetical protein
MSTDRYLEDLVRTARREQAPPVDVVDRVMAALEPEGRPEPADPWLWAAAFSTAAAVVAMALSASLWGWISDPMVPAVLDLMGAIG